MLVKFKQNLMVRTTQNFEIVDRTGCFKTIIEKNKHKQTNKHVFFFFLLFVFVFVLFFVFSLFVCFQNGVNAILKYVSVTETIAWC